MQRKVCVTILLLFSSVMVFPKESELFEHYICYADLGYSLLLDKIQKTFAYSSSYMCFTGEYKESSNLDTLFLRSGYSAIPNDTIRNIIFIKKDNKIVDVTNLYFKGKENIGLPSYCPEEMEKIKVPILKKEKKLLKFRPWILR